MAAHQAPLSLGFSRKEHWSGCHFLLQCIKVKSESEFAHSCPRLLHPWDSPDKSTGVGCHCLLQHQIRKETRQHWFPSTFLKRNVGISGFFWLLRSIWLISENFSHGNYTALPSFSSDSQMIWDSVKVLLSVKWFLMVILRGISSSECY